MQSYWPNKPSFIATDQRSMRTMIFTSLLRRPGWRADEDIQYISPLNMLRTSALLFFHLTSQFGFNSIKDVYWLKGCLKKSLSESSCLIYIMMDWKFGFLSSSTSMHTVFVVWHGTDLSRQHSVSTSESSGCTMSHFGTLSFWPQAHCCMLSFPPHCLQVDHASNSHYGGYRCGR